MSMKKNLVLGLQCDFYREYSSVVLAEIENDRDGPSEKKIRIIDKAKQE